MLIMEARIPFGGFYESMWSEGIDEEERQYAEELAEEHCIPVNKVAELFFKHTHYRVAHNEVAREYALDFQKVINSELKLNVFMTFQEMTSPKYYNFETDKIFVEISYPDVLRLARKVGRNALRKAAKAMFTSYDGFISFYSPDISTWGPMRTWDYNQLYALMQAAADLVSEQDFDWLMYEDCNGIFSTAFDKACDWQTVMLEIGKLVGAKELAKELEEQDDGRRFPGAWANTADYVERYRGMNENILNSNKFRGDL